MTTVQKKWIQMIHVAKNKTGISDDEYRALLTGCAGVTSSADIASWQQYNAVMNGFKKIGFKAEHRTGKTVPGYRNPEWITERQEFYIRGLWDLASRSKDEKSLRALCRRITGGDDITFCRKQDATKLILALRNIAKSAGYNPDRPED